MRYVVWTFRIVIFVLVLLFSLKNTDPVIVRLFGEYTIPEVPLIIVILVAFALGAVYMYLLTLPTRFRRNREITHLKSEVKYLQKDIKVVSAQNPSGMVRTESISSAPAEVAPEGYVVSKDQALLK